MKEICIADIIVKDLNEKEIEIIMQGLNNYDLLSCYINNPDYKKIFSTIKKNVESKIKYGKIAEMVALSKKEREEIEKKFMWWLLDILNDAIDACEIGEEWEETEHEELAKYIEHNKKDIESLLERFDIKGQWKSDVRYEDVFQIDENGDIEFIYY